MISTILCCQLKMLQYAKPKSQDGVTGSTFLWPCRDLSLPVTRSVFNISEYYVTAFDKSSTQLGSWSWRCCSEVRFVQRLHSEIRAISSSHTRWDTRRDTRSDTPLHHNYHKNSSGDEIANVNFLTTISHTRRLTSKYRKKETYFV